MKSFFHETANEIKLQMHLCKYLKLKKSFEQANNSKVSGEMRAQTLLARWLNKLFSYLFYLSQEVKNDYNWTSLLSKKMLKNFTS